MNRLLVIVGSVRPVRTGLPIARWVGALAEEAGWEVDLADLAELALPFMDEPNHPRLRDYQHAHTIAWSERVDVADAIVLVTPEYNHSFSPALKNALDYLSQEWWRKPVGVVSYGGVSAGTRGVTALTPVLVALGLVKTGANVEIPFAGALVADGVFTPTEKETAIAGHLLAELAELAPVLRPLQNR
ncbi:NAD(P)H-dependent oxidoreductase [Galbitalea sp. SE-J8]|uniref:NADPH-dependent FMN reductase n=1 Tax=Galbitalea sp. SE-J8 TaxID=3054952 RepID=UPI00259D1DB7|nr:NAD(P)H-dependent oxidoreductase [Galbitalea sp. SE-J8]MDM4762091.1 NAD(P)H-dependent oxidoreductase [Galbitalea sp. SE-J8]